MLDTAYLQLQAKIEDTIGKFLSSKTILVKLVNSSLVDIKYEAEKLLVEHDQLSIELTNNTKKIDEIKNSGNYTYLDVINLTKFYGQLISHLDVIDHLEKLNEGDFDLFGITVPFLGISVKTLLIIVGGIVVIKKIL